MKGVLSLIVCACSLCAAEAASYARPEEFGSTPLKLCAADHITPSPMRQWHIAGEPPLRAALVSMQGEWGKRARVTLRTPTGRRLTLPVRVLSVADLDAVRTWLRENEFTTIRTYTHGELKARVLSVSYAAGVQMSSSGPRATPDRKRLLVSLAEQDGTVHTFICAAESMSEQDRQMARRTGKLTNDVRVLHEDSLKLLLAHMEDHPSPTEPAALPIAADLPEALACAALRDVSIVHITLGPRGCEADKALRRYLSEHPGAAAVWAQRHVFLICYRDSQGKLPEQCLSDLTQLYRHHNLPTTRNFSDETSYDTNLCSQQVIGRLFVQPQNALVPPGESTYGFQYTPAELQKLSPAEITFGPGLRYRN